MRPGTAPNNNSRTGYGRVMSVGNQDQHAGTPKKTRKILRPEQRRYLTSSELEKLDREMNPNRDEKEIREEMKDSHKREAERGRAQ